MLSVSPLAWAASWPSPREPTTTVVAYPGSTVTVSALGNYLLEVQP